MIEMKSLTEQKYRQIQNLRAVFCLKFPKRIKELKMILLKMQMVYHNTWIPIIKKIIIEMVIIGVITH